MKTNSINLNDPVEVELTAFGAECLNKVVEEVRKSFPTYKHSRGMYVEGETYKAQLWSLFQDFGSSISLGREMPFKVGVISF